MANLEQEVKDRTADLAYSEAQLSGFFATAAMGMGIVDPGFRYVRINQQLAEIHQLSPEESLGKTIAEILPELSAEIEPIVQSVLDTGQPVLHHEISKGLPIHAEMENVYTSSYFPILNTENKVICVGFIFNDITHIKKLEKQLKNAALTDSLTQVANRRYFDEFLQREWQKSLELNQPITLLLLDVDYFKRYNDTYGHLQGDRCLTQVAQGIASAIDTPDALLARYGGEEFALILPNTPADLGLKQAQHIHDRIHQLSIPHIYGSHKQVTVSIGVATWIPQQTDQIKDLIQQADQRLYEAKRQGRDRIICGEVSGC